MPPKSIEITFNEQGQVVLPRSVTAPSETTLLARAYLLQGQEARRDADELLSTSVATPDELKAFVGGRSDITPGDILGAKVAQASAAQLREGVAAASDKATADSGKQLAATKKTSAAVNSLRQESAAAARLADITAKSLAAAQLTATTDSSETVRQAVATADSAARSAAADAADAAARLEAAVAASAAAGASSAATGVAAASTAARRGRPSRPGYVDKIVASLAKRAADGNPQAQPGIDALERLVSAGFFTGVVFPGTGGIPRNVTEDEILDLQVLRLAGPPKQGATKLMQYLDDAMTEAGKKKLMGSTFPRPRSAGTPPSASALLSSPPPAGLPPALTPAPAPAPATPAQTGSGLGGDINWKTVAQSAMDLAEAGSGLEALRLLTQHAAEIPTEKMRALHSFILAHAKE